MNIEIKISDILNICPYCLGLGKLKAMQTAMTYDAGSIRTKDTLVKCSHCDGKGFKKISNNV